MVNMSISISSTTESKGGIAAKQFSESGIGFTASERRSCNYWILLVGKVLVNLEVSKGLRISNCLASEPWPRTDVFAAWWWLAEEN